MTILIGKDDQIVEATPEEAAAIKAAQDAFAANEKRLAEEKAAKEAAKAALLERLGITEDEAKLLLG